MSFIAAIIGLVAASVVSATIQQAVGTGMQYAANSALQEDSQAFNAEEAQKTRDFNAEEAQKGRDFQEYMESTKYQRQVKDMQAAGLNVGAMGTGGGGTVSGSVAQASPTSGAAASSTANSVSQGINTNAMRDALEYTLEKNKLMLSYAYLSNSIKQANNVAALIRK